MPHLSKLIPSAVIATRPARGLTKHLTITPATTLSPTMTPHGSNGLRSRKWSSSCNIHGTTAPHSRARQATPNKQEPQEANTIASLAVGTLIP